LFAQKMLDLFGVEKHVRGDSTTLVRAVYHVWLVGSYKEDEKSFDNKSIQLMTHLDRKELTSHPLIKFIFERKKWPKMVRPIFIVELCLQLFIVAILVSATILSNDRLNLGLYYADIFSGTGWYVLRILIIISALINLTWRLFVPARNLLILRKIEFSYRMISYVGMYTVLLFYLLSTLGQYEAESSNPFAIIQLFFMLNLMSYLPLFPGIGPVVLGVINTVRPILYWGSFFLVVFIAFSVTMTSVAGPYSPLAYSTIFWTMNTLFLGMFGQGDPLDDLLSYNEDPLGLILYYIFMLTVPLLLFNILIAMVTEAYGAVEDDKEQLWRLNRSKLMVELEECIPNYLRQKLVPSAIETAIEPFEQTKSEPDMQAEFKKQLDELLAKIQAQESVITELLEKQKMMEESQASLLESLS